jgi:hypothetical protein
MHATEVSQLTCTTASTTTTLKPTVTTESDAATHLNATHVERVPAQIQVAISKGLKPVPGLRHLFLTALQGIHSFQLFLDRDVALHRGSVSRDSEVRICGQNNPVPLRDYSRVRLTIPVGGDPT